MTFASPAVLLTPSTADRVLLMQRAASWLWLDRASFWHIGGLAWQAGSICGADAAVAVVGSSPAPVAWGWIKEGSHLNALVAAADTASAQSLVAWFTSEASDTEALTATVPSGSQALADALAAVGFARAANAPYNLDMRCGTASAIHATLPSGYRVRALQDGEQAQFVACHRAAWDPQRLPWPETHRPTLPTVAASSFSEAKFSEVQATWPYRRELVTVVEAADGSLVACCIAWLDEATGAAEIEPLGVVPDHRGRGLGRGLTVGAVMAVARAGGSDVTIHPRGDDAYPAARRLYASSGFRSVGSTQELCRPNRR